MATTSATKSGSYVDFDEYIDFQLQKTRSNIKSTDILTAVAGVAAIFLAYLLVFVVFDHWIIDGGFGTVSRWLMLGGLLLACAGWIAWKVIIPYRKNVTQLYAAQTIESTETGLKNTLMNLVDLRNAGRDIPESIRTAMEKRAAVTLSKADVESVVDRRPLMRWSYVLLALVVVCCLYALFSPKQISASVWRALFPASETAVDTAIKIDGVSTEIGDRLHDPDITVPIRSKLNVVVDLSHTGEAPESVTLYYSTEDQKFQDVPITMNHDPNDPKRYRAQFNGQNGRGILQTTSYRVEAGDAKAGPFTVTVVRPPVATVQSVTYNYPKYMERAPRTQDGGHIKTWEGTTVTISAETDQPVRDAKLILSDTEDLNKSVGEHAMTVTDGTKLSITLKKELALRADGSYPKFYHLKCVGNNGFEDPEPVRYGITLRRDLPPKIVLVEPQGSDLDIPANKPSLPILYKASDPDFKVQYVTLHGELTRAARPDDKPRDINESLFEGPARKSVLAKYDWKLNPLQLKTGDSLRFRLQVRDNKQPKANAAFSRWVTLRVVEPVTKNELQQQQQQEQQRRDQLQQQEQRKNQGGDPQNNQQPNGDPQGKKEPGQKQPNNKQQPKNPNGQPDKGMQNGGGNNTQPKQNASDMGTGNPQQNPDGMGQNQTGTDTNPANNTQPPQQNMPPQKPEDAQDLLNQLDENQRRQQDANQNQQPGAKQPQPGNGSNNTGKQPQPKNNGMGTEPKTNGNPDGMNPEGKQPKSPQGKQPNGMNPDGMNPENNAGTKPKNSEPNGMPKTGTEPKTGMENNPGNKEQPGQGTKKEPGKNGGNQGMKTDPGMKPDPKSPKNNTGENSTNSGMPGTEPKNKQQPGKKVEGDNTQKTGTQQKPKTPGGKKTEGGTNNNGMKQAGSEPKKTNVAEGGKTPNMKTEGPGKNPKPKNGMGGNNTNNKTEPPNGGKKETVPDNGKPATKKQATGDETGMAEPGKKTDPKPKTAKNPNKIQRKEGTDPVTKPRMGKTDPMNPMTKQSTKKPTGNGQTETGDPKTGTPKQAPKQSPNGGNNGMKTTTNKTTGGKTPSENGNKTQPKANNGMNGGMPTGQPDGMGKKPPQAGKKPGNGTNNGMPKQKPMGGAKAKPNNNGGKTGMGKPNQGNDPGKPSKGGNQPGGGTGSPKPGNPTGNETGSPGAGTGPFKPNKQLPQLPPPVSTSDQDLQDYGKKASNLQLSRLADQLKRGDVDPKKLGFDNKKDALDFVQKSQARVNNAEKNGDTQMLEYLKTKALRDYQQQAGKRSSEKMRKKALAGVRDSKRSEAPPHLKNYTNAFKNSVGGGGGR